MYTLYPTCVVRDDGLVIPMNIENTDFHQYENWLSIGNTPQDPPQPTLAELLELAKDQIRRDRQPIISILDGLQASSIAKGDAATALVIEVAKQALRDLTKIDLSACQTLAEMKQVVLLRYAQIASASPALKLAFAEATK